MNLATMDADIWGQVENNVIWQIIDNSLMV